MPSLQDIAVGPQPIKLLVLGHSGVGKTGSLASLAIAGYRVFLADFENGFEILLDKAILPVEFRKNVFVKTFVEKRETPDSSPVGGPRAMTEFFDTLTRGWKEKIDGKEVNLGTPKTWNDRDVLVIDTLTMFSNAVEEHVLALNGRKNKQLALQDYAVCQNIVEGLIMMLCSQEVKCNVIIMAHIRPVDDGIQGVKWFPQTTGTKLSPSLGRHFNNVIMLSRDFENNIYMHTRVTPQADLKVAKPSVVPDKMKADLALLFKLLRGSPAGPGKAGE